MIVLLFYFLQLILRINTMPPDQCFAPFRWDDCGMKPTPVMYFYKPGSRCEVAMWKGCLPNLNMFADEHECIKTCIFARRAYPEHYHNLIETDVSDDVIIIDDNETTTSVTGTDETGETDSTGGTEVTGVTGVTGEKATTNGEATKTDDSET